MPDVVWPRKANSPAFFREPGFSSDYFHFSETVDQRTREYAADQNFCWLVQITAPLFCKT